MHILILILISSSIWKGNQSKVNSIRQLQVEWKHGQEMRSETRGQVCIKIKPKMSPVCSGDSQFTVWYDCHISDGLLWGRENVSSVIAADWQVLSDNLCNQKYSNDAPGLINKYRLSLANIWVSIPLLCYSHILTHAIRCNTLGSFMLLLGQLSVNLDFTDKKKFQRRVRGCTNTHW